MQDISRGRALEERTRALFTVFMATSHLGSLSHGLRAAPGSLLLCSTSLLRSSSGIDGAMAEALVFILGNWIDP